MASTQPGLPRDNRRTILDLASAGVPLPSPVEAYFEVANRCNSKCVTCPLTFSPQEAAKQLSLDEFRRLVDQLPALRRAVMQGIGEPLLNRELPAMIRCLKDRGVYVVFNTNAALLTRPSCIIPPSRRCRHVHSCRSMTHT
jgi:uncharacterized radical SAM superfamily Fe-S cluster-containing enzyme